MVEKFEKKFLGTWWVNNITFFFKKAIEDRVIGKCMFNEWEQKILDQLKNNHRRK
jgi:hypothetical protein